VPLDPKVKKAVLAQTPVCTLAPKAPASARIGDAARKITTWKEATGSDGNIKFFWKKLLFPEQPLA